MRGGFDGPMFGERGDLFGGSPVRLGERLKEVDANKDGVVTLEEFLAPRDPTFARAYAVMSVPTLSLFRDGHLVSQVVGARPKSRLSADLDAALMPPARAARTA